MRQYADYLQNIIQTTKCFIRKKNPQEFVDSIETYQMPQTSRTVKSEHLLKKMLYCPFAFPHILKMVFVSNFYASPTAIQIILTIHLDSLLCRKGQNILHIEQKDFSMEEFSIKCEAVVAYKTITSL